MQTLTWKKPWFYCCKEKTCEMVLDFLTFYFTQKYMDRYQCLECVARGKIFAEFFKCRKPTKAFNEICVTREYATRIFLTKVAKYGKSTL